MRRLNEQGTVSNNQQRLTPETSCGAGAQRIACNSICNRLIESVVMRKTRPGLLYAMIGASLAPCSQAAVLEGNPANYQALAAELRPGDTLKLASGAYDRGLLLINKVGTAAQPIVIVGPADHSARL